MSSLFFVYTDHGKFSEEEFNDWYDNEHLPGLLRLPNIVSAQRYVKADDLEPAYLALYDFSASDPKSVLSSPEFANHVATMSEREKKMLFNLPVLSQRTYQPIFQQPETITGPSEKYLFVVEIELKDNASAPSDEFNTWYNNTHFPDIMKTNGWVSGRRFQLDGVRELGTNGDTPQPAAKYLAIHEFTNGDYMKDREMVDAISKEETRKMGAKLIKTTKFRHFFLHHAFHQK